MLALNLLWFILALMVLILVHEAGHMFAAKQVGMRVEKFSIFFGRPLIKWHRGDTEYALGWIPIGGYVKITGFNSTEELPPELAERTYDSKAPWKRIYVILAGPAVNIALAFVLFAITFWIGVPGAVSNQVAAINDDSPAQSIGLMPGDEIVGVNGEPADEPLEIQRLLSRNSAGDTVTLTFVDGDGQEVSRQVVLDPRTIVDADGSERAVQTQEGRPLGVVGFTFDRPQERSSPIGGITDSADITWEVVRVTGELIPRAFTQSEAREQLSGPVGIGAVANEIGDEGIVIVIRFIALLSLALGVFNLLPLLPLDGGHIAVAILNKLSGGRVPPGLVERLSIAGFVFLMLVAVIVLQNDIVRISDGEVIPSNR